MQGRGEACYRASAAGELEAFGRKSDTSLYRHDLATYSENDTFDVSAAVGFIHLYGLPVRTQAEVQGGAS